MGAARQLSGPDPAGLLVRLRAFIRCASLTAIVGCAAHVPEAPAPMLPAVPDLDRPPPVYPDSVWPRWSIPEAAGYSSSALQSVREALRSSPTTSFMAVVGGMSLMEYGDIALISDIGAARGSVYAVLFGFYAQPSDSGAISALAAQDPDALAAAFEAATGMTVLDALASGLAPMIGLQDFERSVHEVASGAGRSGNDSVLYLSTRDMTRIGLLLARGGRWRDRQLLAPEWTQLAARPGPVDPSRTLSGQIAFGNGWWTFPGVGPSSPVRNGFLAMGDGGQYLLVLPAVDMVIAHKAANPDTSRAVAPGAFLDIVDLVLSARCQNTDGRDSIRMCARRQPTP